MFANPFLKAFLLLGLLFLFCFLPAPANGQNERPLDLVIVIDNSGSMSQPSAGEADPLGLRYDAAAMLVDLVSAQDRIGIVHFSDRAEPLTSELILTDSENARLRLRQLLRDAENEPEGGATNYGAALAAAQTLLGGDDRNQRAVIFLTDGLPTDMRQSAGGGVDTNKLDTALAPFVDGSISVYLMLLESKSFAQVAAEVPDVKAAFERTGSTALQLASPQSMARAFAFVLTQLQPSTYLDNLGSGIPATNASTRFEVQVSPSQGVEQATFVFVPTKPTAGFKATVEAAPPNTMPLNTAPENDSYAVVSYASQGPPDGKWQISLNSREVQGFVFVRSALQFRLAYPIPYDATTPGTFVSNQPLLVGVVPEGTVVGDEVQVAIRPQAQCFTEAPSTSQSLQALERAGLSLDESVFWQVLSPSTAQELAFSIELRQSDNPLRLSRCFTLRAAPPQETLTIIEPQAVVEGKATGIPLQVALPGGVTWEQVEGWVESPSGQIERVVLNPQDGRGVTSLLDRVNATYFVRVVAFGRGINGLPITLFAQKEYLVQGTIDVTNPIITLQPIQSFDVPLTSEILLNAPFVTPDAAISFQVRGIRDDQGNSVDEALIKLELCPQVEISLNQVRCSFSIQPSAELPHGSYEALIGLVAPDHDLGLETVRIQFTRPPSQFILQTKEANEEEVLTPVNRDVSYQLLFQRELWSREASLDAHVEQLRRVGADQEVIDDPAQFIQLNLIPPATSEQLRYELVVSEVQPLPPGNYELRVGLTTPHAELSLNPATLPLTFQKEAAFITIAFEEAGEVIRVKERVCGLRWFCIGYPTQVSHPAEISSFYVIDEPTIPQPTVERLSNQEGDASPSALEFAWHIDQRDPTSPERYRGRLSANATDWLTEGEYEVRLVMPSFVQQPREQLMQVQVIGWPTFFWQRGLPLLGLTGVALWWWWRGQGGGTFARGARLIINDQTVLLGGLPSPVQLLVDSEGGIQAVPGDSQEEYVVYRVGRKAIELDFKDGYPLQLRCGESDPDGEIRYLC